MQKLNLSWGILDKLSVTLDPKAKYDCVIGIHRGGLIPAVLASHFYKIPLYTMYVSSYTGTKQGRIKIGDIPDFEGTPLIIDDIYDSGKTLQRVLRKFKNELDMKPDCIVLVTKNKSECVEKGIQYLVEVNKKSWVVFPWEITKKRRTV